MPGRRRSVQEAQRQALRNARPAQSFKTGSGDFLSPNALFADPRGHLVARDQCQNRPPNKHYTMAEQMLFKRDFKRAEQVWRPNSPSHSGRLAVFGQLRHVGNGPENKARKEPLGVWRCSH